MKSVFDMTTAELEENLKVTYCSVPKANSAKEIPTLELLNFFYEVHGSWAFWAGHQLFGYDKPYSDREFRSPYTHCFVFPETIPYKVIYAKFKQLYKNEYIGGCDCGCRGDFEITDKGLLLINKPRIYPYSSY